jgi:hypothetical protein
VEWDGAKIWFDNRTDFRELLGQGIWQLKASDTNEQEIFKTLRRLEKDLEAKAKPISLTFRGPVEFGIFTLYFSLDKLATVEEVDDWSDNVTDELKKYTDIFKSSAGGVDYILLRGGRDLTGEQLLQLLDWINGQGVSRNYLVDITEQIKKHPNWPEDITDWALGDW